MDYIKYVDENEDTILYSYDEFLKESRNLPFEFVLNVANENEALRDQLFNQLFLRSAIPSLINTVSQNPYYKELRNSIINGDDVYKKVHLVLYFEPDLLEPLFNDLDNLVNVIDSSYKDMYVAGIGNYYIKISELYKIDDILANKMFESLNKESKYQVKKMNELFKGNRLGRIKEDDVKKIAEETKQQCIDIIKYNVDRKNKIRKLKYN